MAKYTSGMQVGGGYYWNASNWAVEVIPNEGGRLQGGADARYVKIPFPVLFVVVPLLGALFLMFLPFVGFALFAWAISKKLASVLGRHATELASTVQPGGFAAGSAYFTGKPEEKKEGGEAATGGELERLEREVAERRGEKK